MDRKLTDAIIAEATAVAESAIGWRRHIHANPELSFNEYDTAKFIMSVLDEIGVEYRSVATTGVLVKIEGRGDTRRAVVLRADIDALPVTETSGFEFSSNNQGVMHACGHDIHTSILLGALAVINRHRDDFEGTIFGLFQPGEERNPGGASIVLSEHPFDGYDIRAFIGQHVEPELPTGVFGFHAGSYMASSDELRITMHGVGGHAAMRENLKDPIQAAAQVITALLAIPERNPQIPTVLSIGKVTAEGATNVIPDKVYMEGTFRTFDEAWRAQAKSLIRSESERIASQYGVRAEVNISDGFPVVVNSDNLTAEAQRMTAEIFGKESAVSIPIRMTSEDFGYYTELYPSLFYRVGVGGAAPLTGAAGLLHTSHFNPDEGAIPRAIAEFAIFGIIFKQALMK
jgi:amidohydrolase